MVILKHLQVKNDTELQKWVEEVHTTGFNGTPQGHGFPDCNNLTLNLI